MPLPSTFIDQEWILREGLAQGHVTPSGINRGSRRERGHISYPCLRKNFTQPLIVLYRIGSDLDELAVLAINRQRQRELELENFILQGL